MFVEPFMYMCLCLITTIECILYFIGMCGPLFESSLGADFTWDSQGKEGYINGSYFTVITKVESERTPGEGNELLLLREHQCWVCYTW